MFTESFYSDIAASLNIAVDEWWSFNSDIHGFSKQCAAIVEMVINIRVCNSIKNCESVYKNVVFFSQRQFFKIQENSDIFGIKMLCSWIG